MTKSEGSLIFKSRVGTGSSENLEKEEKTENLLKDGYQNILCLNIDSFTGGVTGIWEKGKDMFDSKN